MNDFSQFTISKNVAPFDGELCIEPLSESVGAEITDVSLDALSSQQFETIRAAWHRHSAVLFRNQDLSDDALMAFSRRFGVLDHAPVMENGQSAVEGKPEIYVISNVLGENGKAIGSLGNGEAVWHTDMSYLQCPPDASLLYALEIPDQGGNTSIAGMNCALRNMPATLLAEIRGKSIKHDGTYNSGGLPRHGVRVDDDPRSCEGMAHPIVCRHPETAVDTLYLGRRRNAWVVGMSLEESEHLLDRLWAHATRPEFVYEHKWRVGDLLLWDNRCTLHRRGSFDAGQRRIMHRTQISGSHQPDSYGR